jgi:uncharacterized membrane protein YdjX (TVP38/TMEM64 family)
MNAERREKILRYVGRSLMVILAIALAAVAVHASGLNEVLDKAWIDEHVRGRGLMGLFAFVGTTALVTGVGAPRQIPAFLAGYAFGALLGTGLALLGTVIGAAGTFAYARLVGRRVLPSKTKGRLGRVESFLAEEPFQTAVAIRFMPLGSNLVTNLVAGVSRVPAPAFLAGSAVGFVPQTFIFALIGKGFRVDPAWRIGVAGVLFVASTLLGARLYRGYRRRAKARRAAASSTASSLRSTSSSESTDAEPMARSASPHTS